MVRRAAEHGEQTETQTHMVLLDWENAFDKTNREALYKAMDEMNIPTKYTVIVKAMHKALSLLAHKQHMTLKATKHCS